MTVASRLPGIQFDVVSPPTAQPLVRMDIAAFVGFSASGPLQVPVAVEDVAHFEEIFGEDLVIASDDTKQPVYACMPSSVRAFFRNGGRRCWVIRVAGDGAVANQFAIPGLLELHGSMPTQAYAPARSEGSWSDGLSVGASLELLAIEINATTIGPGRISVDLVLAAAGDVVPGDLLRLTFAETEERLWLFVDAVQATPPPSPTTTATSGVLATATGTTFYWETLGSPPQAVSTPAAPAQPMCERLTMDLYVANGTDQAWTLNKLGFAPLHPRYWAALPDDVTAYGTNCSAGLTQDALYPRFPLCGPPPPDPTAQVTSFYLPLTIGALPSFSDLKVPSNPATDRNGLAHFGAEIFLDRDLVDVTTNDMLAKAFYLQYQSPYPRALTGIHAALALDEVTVIAAPDAVQRGWIAAGEDPLASPPDASPLAHPEWWHFLDCEFGRGTPRVAAPPPGQFQDCGLQIIDPPLVELTAVVNGSFHVEWAPMAGAIDTLEEAADPEFETAAAIYQGSDGTFAIYGRAPGDYYYRVKRQVGSFFSNYSNAVGLRIESGSGYQEESEETYRNDALVAVHRSLLQMCAARGDLFGVLALPGHYRDGDAIRHASLLRSLPDGAEAIARSFGAIYHPWLIGREEDDLNDLRDSPPDGAIAGIIGKRSFNRGPWISPASELLAGVVDLTPPIGRGSRQALQDAQVNLVRQAPGGFLCLSALTLSDDDDLTPINVRRLLSFLRKTSIKAGVDYIFEPNDDRFRRGVQRGFEKLLNGLFLQGAFAGRVASDAFQVVTDSSINTRATADRGEFYVELRVAPSLPMRFLTIRLLQTADTTLVSEAN
jgi:hypothetical protein